MTIRKYSKVIQMNIYNSLEYRINFILNMVSAVVPILIQVFIWTNIFSFNGINEFKGYSRTNIILYMVIAGSLSKLLSIDNHQKIAGEIKNGGLNQYILKPVNHTVYWISNEIGGKLIYCLLLYTIFFIISSINNVNQLNAILFGGIAMYLGVIINFLLYYLISMLSFWFLDISSIFTAVHMIFIFLYGGVLPLDILAKANNILYYIPFGLTIFFPVRIFSTTIAQHEILFYILLQVLWIVVLFIVSALLWKKGFKKYTAIGG